MVFTKSRGPLDANTYIGSSLLFPQPRWGRTKTQMIHVFILHSKMFLLKFVKIEFQVIKNIVTYLSCREVILGCVNRWSIS